MKIIYVFSASRLADIFTKPRSEAANAKLLMSIMYFSTSGEISNDESSSDTDATK